MHMQDTEKRLSALEQQAAGIAYRAGLDPFTRAVLDKVAAGVPAEDLSDDEVNAFLDEGVRCGNADPRLLSDDELDAWIAQCRAATAAEAGPRWRRGRT